MDTKLICAIYMTCMIVWYGRELTFALITASLVSSYFIAEFTRNLDWPYIISMTTSLLSTAQISVETWLNVSR